MLKGADLDKLTRLVNMEILDLSLWVNLQNEDMNLLSKFPKLKRLYLKSCTSLTMQGFSNLAKCKNLELLQLEYNNISANDLMAVQKLIGALPKLTKIVLPVPLRLDKAFMDQLRTKFPKMSWE